MRVYDALVRKIIDCDSDSNVMNATFNALGFKTAIIVRSGHAIAIYEVNEKCFTVLGHKYVDVQQFIKSRNGQYIYVGQTNGNHLIRRRCNEKI